MRSVWLLVFVLAFPSCRPERSDIYADLPEAPGVREGAVVRYRGVQIGEVRRVTFADSVVHITIRLTRSDVPLRTRDGVRLAAEGVFGDRTLDVVPGPTSAPALHRGETLHAAPPDTLADLRRELLESRRGGSHARSRCRVEARYNPARLRWAGSAAGSAVTRPSRPCHLTCVGAVGASGIRLCAW